ncbi:MAG: endonuclease VII domain-containing protein [Nanoarchaeota archaeon]|nr:endonuclease VII domain-containing protein [Nanoarchaeota archaeon]
MGKRSTIKVRKGELDNFIKDQTEFIAKNSYQDMFGSEIFGHLKRAEEEKYSREEKRKLLKEEWNKSISNRKEETETLFVRIKAPKFNKNKNKNSKEYKKIIFLSEKYNITEDVYCAMVQQQNGKCYVCEKIPDKRGLYIDHNHEDGRVRKLLCSRCNTMLGHYSDDVRFMREKINYLKDLISYVEEHQSHMRIFQENDFKFVDE